VITCSGLTKVLYTTFSLSSTTQMLARDNLQSLVITISQSNAYKALDLFTFPYASLLKTKPLYSFSTLIYITHDYKESKYLQMNFLH